MTSEQTPWFAAPEPHRLLELVRADPPPDIDRRFRLFAAACVRLVWDILPTDARSAVQVAERFADGAASPTDLTAAAVRPTSWFETPAAAPAGTPAPWGPLDGNPTPGQLEFWPFLHAYEFTTYVARATASKWARQAPSRVGPDRHERWNAGIAAALARQADLVRCLFHPPGGPPPAADPAWLTATVRQLADLMYASRDFSRMPVLADALQDAGCEDADILAHCRGPGPHARGCRVVDLIRGGSVL